MNKLYGTNRQVYDYIDIEIAVSDMQYDYLQQIGLNNIQEYVKYLKALYEWKDELLEAIN